MIRLALLLCLLAVPATAEPICEPRDFGVKALERVFGEQRIGVGLDGDGRLIELFANLETGTFTLIAMEPKSAGISCLVVEGVSWQVDLGESR